MQATATPNGLVEKVTKPKDTRNPDVLANCQDVFDLIQMY
jgi:hypothetical protein